MFVFRFISHFGFAPFLLVHSLTHSLARSVSPPRLASHSPRLLLDYEILKVCTCIRLDRDLVNSLIAWFNSTLTRLDPTWSNPTQPNSLVRSFTPLSKRPHSTLLKVIDIHAVQFFFVCGRVAFNSVTVVQLDHVVTRSKQVSHCCKVWWTHEELEYNY